MAVNFRVEFVRLRSRNAAGLQDMDAVGNVAPVHKTLTGTALTGAGRITVPANVGGYSRFHARIVTTVDAVVSIAPAGDAGTTYDASQTGAGGISIPANSEKFIPVSPGQLISAATGIVFI